MTAQFESLGVRRLAALTLALPPEAATWRDDTHGWTIQAELSAGLIETADFWGRVQAIRSGVKPRDLPAPPDIKHPGRERFQRKPETSVVTDPQKILAFFAGRG